MPSNASLGKYDWGATDESMTHLRRLGIEPIIDPCHHVSVPRYLGNGFLNPDFAQHYTRFVSRALERYDWVRYLTVFNEPYPTTLFAGRTGQCIHTGAATGHSWRSWGMWRGRSAR